MICVNDMKTKEGLTDIFGPVETSWDLLWHEVFSMKNKVLIILPERAVLQGWVKASVAGSSM